MRFIAKPDFQTAIDGKVLDDITQVNDIKLSAAAEFAVRFMEGYLNARYDVKTIFSKSGNERDEVIKGYAVDIAIYRLHSLISPRKIPKYRKENYELAVEWLENVCAAKINPPGLPLIQDNKSRDSIMFGGNDKRENFI